MHRVLFSGPALIELEGAAGLQLTDWGDQLAQYQLNGFETPAVVIKDERRAAGQTAQRLDAERTADFARCFSVPAQVTITQTSKRRLLITLADTQVGEPRHTLWLAFGIDPWVPAYDYLMEHIVPFGEKEFALLALYHQPQAEDPLWSGPRAGEGLALRSTPALD